MKNWTESKALSYLMNLKAENPTNKLVIQKGGWNGLKACSAMDFLRNKCGFRFLMKRGA